MLRKAETLQLKYRCIAASAPLAFALFDEHVSTSPSAPQERERRACALETWGLAARGQSFFKRTNLFSRSFPFAITSDFSAGVGGAGQHVVVVGVAISEES